MFTFFIDNNFTYHIIVNERSQMSKDTREKILENALEMFANKGYEGTNIRELSDTLGVSKGAMYRHYESKEKLWDSVVDKVHDQYLKNVVSSNDFVDIPNNTDELMDMSLNMMINTMHDPNIIIENNLEMKK